jgi:transcriptional regulator with XRE-family HTH domain
LPFRQITLKAVKPELMADEGDTLAAHLRRVRKERGLKQIEVAAFMDVSETSVLDWENGKQPHARMFPTIIGFLGYEPWPEARTLADMLLAERRRRGLSAKRAAKLLCVDEGTWGRWERDRQPSCPGHHATITTFLAGQRDD